MWRKYSIDSSLLAFSPSTALTYLLFSIAPLAVAPLLTSSLLPPLSPFLAPGRCFRIWVLITYQFFYLFLSFRSFAPTSVPLPSIFRKLAETILLLTFDSYCFSAEEYSSVSLSFPATLFTSLALNAAKSSIPFGRIKRHPKAWWFTEVELAVSEGAKLSLPLTEVIKTARLTSSLPDALRLSSPRLRLRHGWRFALLSRLNLTLNYMLSFSLCCWLFFLIFLFS